MKALFLFLVLSGSGTLVGWASDGVPSDWKKFSEKDGLTLYEKDIPGTRLVAFKGEGVVQASLLKVASVLTHRTRLMEWVDNLEEIRLLKQISPTEYVEYVHMGTPFVLKDRDFINHVKLIFDEKNKTVTIQTHPYEGPEWNADLGPVRGKVMDAKFIISPVEGGKATRIIAEMAVDPMGSVPKWIVNLFQRAWPKKAFEGIQEQLKKSDVKMADDMVESLRPLVDWEKAELRLVSEPTETPRS